MKNTMYSSLLKKACLSACLFLIVHAATGQSVPTEGISAPGNSKAVLNIYPNPSHPGDFLTIKADFANRKLLSVEMYETGGRLVVKPKSLEIIDNSLLRLPLGNLRPDLYLLMLRFDDGLHKELITVK